VHDSRLPHASREALQAERDKIAGELMRTNITHQVERQQLERSLRGAKDHAARLLDGALHPPILLLSALSILILHWW